jgi:predicted HicB family RNase H-like nuclease
MAHARSIGGRARTEGRADMHETDDRVTFATRIPKRLHRALKLLAIEQETTVTALVTAALKARLAAGSRKRGTPGDEAAS